MVTQYSHDPLKGIPLKHYTSGDWQYQYMYSTSTLKRIYLTYIRHVIWKTGVKFIVLICQLCSTFWPVRSLITTSSLWKHYFVRHFNMAMFFVGFFFCVLCSLIKLFWIGNYLASVVTSSYLRLLFSWTQIQQRHKMQNKENVCYFKANFQRSFVNWLESIILANSKPQKF